MYRTCTVATVDTSSTFLEGLLSQYSCTGIPYYRYEYLGSDDLDVNSMCGRNRGATVGNRQTRLELAGCSGCSGLIDALL